MRSALLATASAAEAGAPADDLADLFFCLAAAFLPPPAQVGTQAWCESLADDLVDLSSSLGIDTTTASAALRDSAAEPDAGEPWLIAYSRLFLVPPVPVTLNTGMYLEGSLGGVSAQMIEQCYATAGFRRREEFRDLPDHVGTQFEFIGALLERADDDSGAMAREFTDEFIRHWIDPLQAALMRAAERDAAARAYAALTRVAQAALDVIP
jgi:TorA maturation chaperone TorD